MNPGPPSPPPPRPPGPTHPPGHPPSGPPRPRTALVAIVAGLVLGMSLLLVPLVAEDVEAILRGDVPEVVAS